MNENFLKYQIGTEENKRFLEDIREELFRFGRSFFSLWGSVYYLDQMGYHVRKETVRHRSQAVWCMYTVWTACWDIRRGFDHAGVRGITGEFHDDKSGG